MTNGWSAWFIASCLGLVGSACTGGEDEAALAAGQVEEALTMSIGPRSWFSTTSGKCVGTANFGSMENGTPLIIWDCHEGNDQKWLLGGERIRNTISAKCVGTANFGSMENGTPLIIWDCHGGNDQRWALQGELLRNAISAKCVSTANFGSMENGTPLIIWDCHGGNDQRWHIPTQ